MVKKLVSGPILSPLAQIWAPKFFSWTLLLLDVKHCCKLSLYAFSRKTNELNLRKWQKSSFGPNFDPLWPKFGHQFFFKSLACQSLDIMVSYHHVEYQKKLMIQFWENLVTDGRTDGQTGGQMDENDFIGRCLTNIKRPKSEGFISWWPKRPFWK